MNDIINETKSWFFEKIDKIKKPSPKLTKRRKGKTKINKIRNEKGNIITDSNEIQKIIWEYLENLNPNKLENQEETDKFLNTHG
jgi:hypothetical protein